MANTNQKLRLQLAAEKEQREVLQKQFDKLAETNAKILKEKSASLKPNELSGISKLSKLYIRLYDIYQKFYASMVDILTEACDGNAECAYTILNTMYMPELKTLDSKIGDQLIGSIKQDRIELYHQRHPVK